MRIILASKSPRRHELLSRIGIEFECIVSEKDEVTNKTLPSEVVCDLSANKAEEVFDMLDNKENCLVIGADTVVALDNEIMGKPVNREHAEKMLRNLSGREHSVWTGVTIINGKTGQRETFAQETKVWMYPINDEELKEYLSTDEPYDKAGSYAIQGIATKFIKYIEGDFNNVVGLPVAALYQRLKDIK